MDATLLANNSQHCWMLHVECDCTPFKDGMSLRNGMWQAVYKSGTGTGCLVPRPHYYARPMRFGSRGPRKFLTPRQTRRSETFCRTWGGAFGSGRAVNNFSALICTLHGCWTSFTINRAFLFYARFHC